jgi:uncharacterized membrane protein
MFFISAITMIILDSIYLTITSNFYNNLILGIQGSKIILKILPTFLTYVILILGLNYFIISRKKSVKEAAILGFLIYSVFELTNMAIFDKWTINAVIIDSLWGATLFALTTFITYKLSSIFLKH